MNARDDTKIESCNLRTLKRIARALDVSVKDLFDDDITDDPHGDGSESID
jgi:DNA-binding Xre family transcriptional regulator